MIPAKQFYAPQATTAADKQISFAALFSGTYCGESSTNFTYRVDDRSMVDRIVSKILRAREYPDNSSAAFKYGQLVVSQFEEETISRNRAAIELLSKWLAEHPFVEEDAEWDRLKQRLNENRLSDRRRF